MCVYGVQIARREVLKSMCSHTRTIPRPQRTEGNQWYECGRAE